MKKIKILIRMLLEENVFLAYIKDNQPYIYSNSNETALKVYSALGNNQKRKHGRLTKRIANVKKGNRAYCISHVYINGVYSHDTIEDYDRGLDSSWSLAKIASVKIPDKTAIPTGTYTVKMNIVSNTFAKKLYYKNFCKGMLPRLDPVPGYAGILIHRGVNETSTSGCLIVGYNKAVGSVTHSQEVFESFYRKLKSASDRGEKITYKIIRNY